jgi:hypothetical protein
MHTCKRLITVVTIFSFLHICQTDSVAALGCLGGTVGQLDAHRDASLPTGWGTHGQSFLSLFLFCYSLPFFPSLSQLSQLSYTYLITFDKQI